jgi:hypothetical protein
MEIIMVTLSVWIREFKSAAAVRAVAHNHNFSGFISKNGNYGKLESYKTYSTRKYAKHMTI